MNNIENISILKKEKCCGCHSCYNICPKKLLVWLKTQKDFYILKFLKIYV